MNYDTELMRRFPFVVAWHHNSSLPPYVNALLRRAEADNAHPLSVYYCGTRKEWVTLDECAESTQLSVIRRARALNFK